MHLCSLWCVFLINCALIFCCLLYIRELKRNRIKIVESLTFQGLESLKSLKMQRNGISRLMDGAFFGLNSIEELWVYLVLEFLLGTFWVCGGAESCPLWLPWHQGCAETTTSITGYELIDLHFPIMLVCLFTPEVEGCCLSVPCRVSKSFLFCFFLKWCFRDCNFSSAGLLLPLLLWLFF